MTAPLSLEEAQRDVRAKTRALEDAERHLLAVRACSILVHSVFTPGCARCEARDAADCAVTRALNAFTAAQRRLEAVESQQRDPQWIGGER